MQRWSRGHGTAHVRGDEDPPPRGDRENISAAETQQSETLHFNNMYSIMTIGQIHS